MRRREVVVVTGAWAGFGRATASPFRCAGASVGLIARNRERLETLASEIQCSGGRALVLPPGVADADAVERGGEPRRDRLQHLRAA